MHGDRHSGLSRATLGRLCSLGCVVALRDGRVLVRPREPVLPRGLRVRQALCLLLRQRVALGVGYQGRGRVGLHQCCAPRGGLRRLEGRGRTNRRYFGQFEMGAQGPTSIWLVAPPRVRFVWLRCGAGLALLVAALVAAWPRLARRLGPEDPARQSRPDRSGRLDQTKVRIRRRSWYRTPARRCTSRCRCRRRGHRRPCCPSACHRRSCRRCRRCRRYH